MKIVSKLTYIIVSILASTFMFFSCHKYDMGDSITMHDEGDSLVTLRFDFDGDFAPKTLTRTRDYTYATERELELINGPTMLVFENSLYEGENPSNDFSKIDVDGRLLALGEAVWDPEADDELNVGEKGAYITKIHPYNKPVTIFAVANLSEEKYNWMMDKYNSGEGFTYDEFRTSTLISIETERVAPEDANGVLDGMSGATVVSESNRILANLKNTTGETNPKTGELRKGLGILPISVDPIIFPNLTQESIDASNNPGATSSKFSYARIDVMLSPDVVNASGAENIEIKAAYLANVPRIPNYTGGYDHIYYTDITRPVTKDTNLPTGDAAFDLAAIAPGYSDNHFVQGLYCYPNNVELGADTTVTYQESPFTYIIIKARIQIPGQPEGSTSDEGEYYKVIIRYPIDESKPMDVNNTNYDIMRNTRYLVQMNKFEGSGYKTLREAFENPPSNVSYDIFIDSESGNEFVVTNGTAYMALSNTVIDIFADRKDIDNVAFNAFSIYYEHNLSAKDATADDAFNSLTKEIYVEDENSGLIIVNEADFECTSADTVNHFKHKTHKEIQLAITEDFNQTANLVVRVGNLKKSITVNWFYLDSETTEIKRYEREDADTPSPYTYAYLDYGDEVTPSTASWINFGETTSFEYQAIDGDGVPIDIGVLAAGFRNNFDSPAVLYSLSGESTRLYITQENLEEIDFSDPKYVNRDYIGGSYKDDTTNLTLSNCYILNPGVRARKFYIPITTRIEQVWNPNKPYTTSQERSDFGMVNGKLPESWKVKVQFYDSQLIYDGNFTVSKEIAKRNGEDCFSIVIPGSIENYGMMQVAVTNAEDEVLWTWSFWVTDYDPTMIARNSTPKGEGSYTVREVAGTGGTNYYFPTYHKATDGVITEDNIQQYSDGDWADSLYLGRRFIMDRNLGVFAKSAIGLGVIWNSTVTAMISEPLSGASYYQYGNHRPVPGSGALDADGRPFDIIPDPGATFRTIVYTLQRPNQFFFGDNKYGTWVDDAEDANDGVNDLHVNWHDVDVNLNVGLGRVTKSIFDPSPLGWMAPPHNTFNAFTTGTLTYNVSPLITADVIFYKKFAQFFLTSYRASIGGDLQYPKVSYRDCWLRLNVHYNAADSRSLAMDSGTTTVSALDADAQSGKAAGLGLRSVTQATY